MFWNREKRTAATLADPSASVDARRLRALIDQATDDSLDESDEHAGLLGTVREEVACPFLARLDGVEVECIRIESPRVGYGINAVCKSPGKLHIVDISKLEWTDPRPAGFQWIEAYLAWRDLVG